MDQTAKKALPVVDNESPAPRALQAGPKGGARPRVLVIGARGIPNMEGGAEKNAEELFPRLVASGYDVTLMGLKPYIRSDVYKGVKLVSAPHVRLLNTDKIVYYAYGVLQALRTRPEIVHLQGLGSAIFLLLYKLFGCKVVVRYGSADYIVGKWGAIGKFGFLFAEWQLRFADAVISVTPSLSARLATRGIKDNVHLIPNALDGQEVTTTESVPTAAQYIVAVGRVTAQKNIHTLLQAFALFSQKHPEHRLVVAGGLDDQAYVKTLEPLLSDKVILLGRVPRSHVPGLLVKSDLFANISFHEGSSNATLEAVSHDRPILVSAIPENRDINLPENFYVDPSDPEAVAARFEEAIAYPERFVADRSRFLSWTQVNDKTAAVYTKILGGAAVAESYAP